MLPQLKNRWATQSQPLTRCPLSSVLLKWSMRKRSAYVPPTQSLSQSVIQETHSDPPVDSAPGHREEREGQRSSGRAEDEPFGSPDCSDPTAQHVLGE